MTRSKFRQQVVVAKDKVGSLGAIPPQQNDGTAITGAYIDRLGAASAKLVFETAAPTGSPSAATALIKIQHCATSGGSYTDFLSLETALDVSAAILKTYLFKLEGAHQFIKVYVDLAYTGGTTPKNILAAELLLGDYDVDPPLTESVLN